MRASLVCTLPHCQYNYQWNRIGVGPRYSLRLRNHDYQDADWDPTLLDSQIISLPCQPLEIIYWIFTNSSSLSTVFALSHSTPAFSFYPFSSDHSSFFFFSITAAHSFPFYLPVRVPCEYIRVTCCKAGEWIYKPCDHICNEGNYSSRWWILRMKRSGMKQHNSCGCLWWKKVKIQENYL